jgi:hypothetical protein
VTSSKGPAKGTRILNGRYYLVRAEGPKRVWIGLTKVAEGLPAFYAALAEQHRAPTVADDLMPKSSLRGRRRSWARMPRARSATSAPAAG